jgi:nucleoside-diphosphate-sugar epimerase
VESTPKKVLVTGGAGYIGSVLSEKIQFSGKQLVIFDNFSHNKNGIKKIQDAPNVKIINGDLRDIEKFKVAIDGVDFVIHLAGISDGRSGKRDPELTYRINQSTFPELIEESKKAGVKRFILASTMGVYGNKYTVPLTEKMKIAPAEPYSESKAYAEMVLKENTTNEFTTVLLRMAMVYGFSPRMRFDFIVNNLVMQAVINKKLTIIGGKQKRPQIHIQDITSYLLHFLDADTALFNGEIFNAGAENPSILEIAKLICKLLPATKISVQQADYSENTFELDSNKLKEKLGLYPEYNIESGIKQLISYFDRGYWKDPTNKQYYN